MDALEDKKWLTAEKTRARLRREGKHKSIHVSTIEKWRDLYLKSWNCLKESGAANASTSTIWAILEFIEESLLGGDVSKYL